MYQVIINSGIDVAIGNHIGKKVIIGSDHRGYDHKQRIIDYLKEINYTVIDVGTYSRDRCDYPAISDSIGAKVSEDPTGTVGIGICGSGIGILIPAGKHKGVYTARCLTPEDAATSRMHNNSNMLGISADRCDVRTAINIVDAWLDTKFYSDPVKDQPYMDRFIQTVQLERRLK